MGSKGHNKGHLQDKLNRLAQDADYEKYREEARDVAHRLWIYYNEFIQVGFAKEEAIQLLMAFPFGSADFDDMEFFDDDDESDV